MPDAPNHCTDGWKEQKNLLDLPLESLDINKLALDIASFARTILNKFGAKE